MPSSSTLTTFYSFTAGTKIKSAEVNANFDAFRGNILPVHPSSAIAATSATYDLGASDHYWKDVYSQSVAFAQNATSPSSPTSGFNKIYFKTDGKAYSKNSSGVESALGGGALVVTGTAAGGLTITAAGGITYSTSGGSRQMYFVVGDTTTGTDISANPQISAGSEVGQELFIVGTDNDRYVYLEDGNGLSLNGAFSAYQYSTLGLVWNGTVWSEMTRR